MTSDSSFPDVGAIARREVFRGLRLGGVNALARRFSRGRLLVVCYHGVNDGPRSGQHGLIVSTREFTRQLEYLASTFRLQPIDHAVEALTEGRLTEPTACITFDDGYRNTFDVAYPVMRQLGIPSTVFLATGFIGTSRRLWTTDLELLFEQAPPQSIDLSSLGLGVLPLDSAARRRAIALEVNRRLKRLTISARSTYLAAIRAQLDVCVQDRDGDFAFMSWDGARALGATGDVTLGAHTVNHEILGRIEPTIRAREIADSVEHVAHELASVRASAVSRVFAYPNGDTGDFTDACIPELLASGCRSAVTTQTGLCARTDSRFALPRVVVSGRMTFPEFCARASGTPALWHRAS